ncbi:MULTISPECIES: hypothetical protein [unclassified Streptomyces]|uniref:hypothetical protein n=1 Tax=unclassified Streptomyces TaxID=2593676 RepID=UPI00037C4BF8|nr:MULTISPECIES: hypothetical protein [unclassified Streptomyces]MYY06524.1 hypothetical protein [Streptomyces sp. SID4913]
MTERLGKALSLPGRWSPRRPRLVGAILALGSGVAITGCGVLGAVMHDGPWFVTVGYAVVVTGNILGLIALCIPSWKHAVALMVPCLFLLAMVPYGFRSAVLDWRGEQVRATVTEVKQRRTARVGGVDYGCKVETPGRSFWFWDNEPCGRNTRPGDRFEILRDPHDLVAAASTSSRPIGFPVLVAGAGAALLLMSAVGAWTMTPSARGGGAPPAGPRRV